jgi:acetoin utilization deacetylase AcuC-like enzyme
MKTRRLLLTNELIKSYGLYQKMNVIKPYRATAEDMQQYHTEDYITFLQAINANRISNDLKAMMNQYEIGTKERDCPVFAGMFNFTQISAGGSISAAHSINIGDANIAVNWAGGLHHARKSMASGFCYVNDIVLCILELLKVFARVLYVDIDIHHGDGVEEAFFTSNRVMTVSFHRYGNDFFPGTGDYDEIGRGQGLGYSVNVPLKAGIVDEDYDSVFASVIRRVMDVFNPTVIVMQCGGDSITGDRLGDFNLTFRSHGHCVRFMRNYNIPLIILGE